MRPRTQLKKIKESRVRLEQINKSIENFDRKSEDEEYIPENFVNESERLSDHVSKLSFNSRVESNFDDCLQEDFDNFSFQDKEPRKKPLEQCSVDIAFQKWAVKHKINDTALKELHAIFEMSHKDKVIPKIKYASQISINDRILICNTCNLIKISEFCSKCGKITLSGTLLILNCREQCKEIIESNFENFTLSDLGYTNDSIFRKLHSESENLISLTLNTDGMVVYKKGHISAWPFYLTINELPMVLKYKIKKCHNIGNIYWL